MPEKRGISINTKKHKPEPSAQATYTKWAGSLLYSSALDHTSSTSAANCKTSSQLSASKKRDAATATRNTACSKPRARRSRIHPVASFGWCQNPWASLQPYGNRAAAELCSPLRKKRKLADRDHSSPIAVGGKRGGARSCGRHARAFARLGDRTRRRKPYHIRITQNR